MFGFVLAAKLRRTFEAKAVTRRKRADNAIDLVIRQSITTVHPSDDRQPKNHNLRVMPMRASIAPTASIVAGMFALLGSLTAASASTAASYETCGRLTAQQASAVLHKTVTVAVDTSAGDGQSNCTYTIATGGVVRLYVTVGADAKRQFQATKDGLTEPHAVSGIGDQAYDSGQGFGAIEGDHFVAAVGNSPADPTGRQRLVQAMLVALR